MSQALALAAGLIAALMIIPFPADAGRVTIFPGESYLAIEVGNVTLVWETEYSCDLVEINQTSISFTDAGMTASFELGSSAPLNLSVQGWNACARSGMVASLSVIDGPAQLWINLSGMRTNEMYRLFLDNVFVTEDASSTGSLQFNVTAAPGDMYDLVMKAGPVNPGGGGDPVPRISIPAGMNMLIIVAIVAAAAVLSLLLISRLKGGRRRR
jgi:hypothetical protein